MDEKIKKQNPKMKDPTYSIQKKTFASPVT